MTKFPGGGLDYGEGPEDCMLREAMEEFGQEVEIERHFYTTGFFQPTIFFIDQQLISIYYKIKLKEKPRFNISEKKFDFTGKFNGSQSFRWVQIKALNKEELTFPVDRHVAGLLLKEYV
jgi:ADP-ribose pyrophosphatase YjhB (NUDIX family)